MKSLYIPVSIGLETCGSMYVTASHTLSTSIPVSMPSESNKWTTSSVATFPVAPGANGQPPNPPADVSKRFTPACSEAKIFASANFRVSWKCAVSGMFGNSF